MDFKELKKNAKKIADAAKDVSQDALQKGKELSADAIDYSAKKLADSKLTLKTPKDLEDFIKKSLPTEGVDSQTGKKKKFSHQVIVIFADPKSDVFESLTLSLPVLSTKAFSQNMSVRLADMTMKGLDTSAYSISGNDPVLVLMQDGKVKKTISGEENIQKVVKNMSLDIAKTINSL